MVSNESSLSPSRGHRHTHKSSAYILRSFATTRTSAMFIHERHSSSASSRAFLSKLGFDFATRPRDPAVSIRAPVAVASTRCASASCSFRALALLMWTSWVFSDPSSADFCVQVQGLGRGCAWSRALCQPHRRRAPSHAISRLPPRATLHGAGRTA